ncbi:MAG: glycosyltransferase [Bryobacter sp.]|nr:glycosyltransferase [Bryobacter sp.]
MANPLISVIVPAFDNAQMLEPCLRSVRESDFEDYELLVADDGSADGSGIEETAARWNARLVRLAENRGPAAARNRAAAEARGEILLFLDADVTAHRETLRKVSEAFAQDAGLDAVIGSYDDAPGVKGTIAWFRNLLHSHVHARSAGPASTFWAGCGAVRKERFRALGGFDESYRRPSIEDVEFGMRLHRAGWRIVLDPRIQVKHHKEWTLGSMMRTDAIDRANPWTELMLQHGLPQRLNFRWQDRASVMASVLMPAVIWLAVVHGRQFLVLGAGVACAFLAFNAGLLRFLAGARGVRFAAQSIPLLVLHHWAAIAGLAVGLGSAARRRDRWFWWAAGVLAVASFGVVMGAGGAFTAEYDGYPDESAHFMTGLMIRDYLLTWPPAPPLRYAEQYYLHYPKVAFGHWPPLFHTVAAVWWLFVPPSRVTALLLVGGFGFAGALTVYWIGRGVASRGVALGTALLMVATPVFQQSIAMVMSDSLSLFLGAQFLWSMIRHLDEWQGAPRMRLGLWCLGALLVKGTGLVLLGAAIVGILLGSRWLAWWGRNGLQVLLVAVAPAAVWYVFQEQLLGGTASWAGIGSVKPWAIPLLLNAAGPVVGALAVLAGLRGMWEGDAHGTAAGSVLLSAAAVSYVLRAMNEPRHFLVAMPALAFLAMTAIYGLWRWRRYAGVAALGGVLLTFPWTLYQQQPAGFRKLISELSLPERMLVSTGAGFDEGSLVALVAEREARPGSTIARAIKMLAQASWVGTRYRLMTRTPEEVVQVLDRYGINVVVAAGTGLTTEDRPHHRLVMEALGTNPNWRPCAESGKIRAYRRVRRSEDPVEPIQLDLRRRRVRSILEGER